MIKLLTSVFLFHFASVAGAIWSPPFNVSPANPTGTAAAPQIAVDISGNAVAIWTYNNTLQAARLPFGSKNWIPINNGLPNLQVLNPQVAVDCKGNAVLIWTKVVLNGFVIQAATLPFHAKTWIATDDLTAVFTNNPSPKFQPNPQIAVDCKGNAVAVWTFNDGSSYFVQAATLPFGSHVWTPASNNLSSPIPYTIHVLPNPKVAVDERGDAIAVWTSNNPSLIVQAATLPHNTAAWISRNQGLPNPGPTEEAFKPQVAVDKAGNAVVVFEMNAGSNTELGMGAAILPFGEAEWISANEGLPGPSLTTNPNNPQVAIDCTGKAVAIWQFQKSKVPNLFVIQAATLPSGSTTWIPASTDLTPADPNLQAYAPQIATNSLGYFAAVWELKDLPNASSYIQAAILHPGSNQWGASQNISSIINGTANFSPSPEVAVGGFNKAVSLWSTTETNNIQSARTLPPPKFFGKVILDIFPTQTEYVHVLSWEKINHPCAVYYRIYCGKQIVATTESNQICLHNQKKGNLPRYKLVAYDSKGTPLSSLVVTWVKRVHNNGCCSALNEP